MYNKTPSLHAQSRMLVRKDVTDNVIKDSLRVY